MINACVTDNIVKQNFQSSLVCLIKKTPGVFVGSVTGTNTVVIRYIIPRIMEWRLKERINPDAICTKTFNIIKFFRDSLKVSYTVGITVVKSLRINLVKYRVMEPARAIGYRILTGYINSSVRTVILRINRMTNRKNQYEKKYRDDSFFHGY